MIKTLLFSLGCLGCTVAAAQPPVEGPRKRIVLEESFTPGGQQKDSSVNIKLRAMSVDVELNIWIAFTGMPKSSIYNGIDVERVKLIEDAFEKRSVQHDVNFKLISQIRLAEQLDSIIAQGVPSNLARQGLEGYPYSSPPDAVEQNRVLAQYYRDELKAERDLSESLTEILNLQEQEVYLKPLTRLDAFLAHPVGIQFLGIDGPHEKEIRKALQINSKMFYDRARAQKRKFVEENSNKTKVTLDFGDLDPKDEVFSKRVEVFGLLSEAQFTKFMQMNGSLAETETAADWPQKLTNRQKSIAIAMLPYCKPKRVE